MAERVFVETATIASGATTSNAVRLYENGKRLFSVIFPTMTGATISFEASYDDGANWYPVWKDGALYTKTVAAGKNDDVDLQRFSSIPMLRVVSASAEAAARTITLVLRNV